MPCGGGAIEHVDTRYQKEPSVCVEVILIGGQHGDGALAVAPRFGVVPANVAEVGAHQQRTRHGNAGVVARGEQVIADGFDGRLRLGRPAGDTMQLGLEDHQIRVLTAMLGCDARDPAGEGGAAPRSQKEGAPSLDERYQSVRGLHRRIELKRFLVVVFVASAFEELRGSHP